MLRLSVAQNPIMPVTDGTKTFQKSAVVANADGLSNIGPMPPARPTSHTISQTPMARINGADQFSKWRTAFIPISTMTMLIDQKMEKVMSEGMVRPMTIAPLPISPNAGQTDIRKVRTASPPM